MPSGSMANQAAVKTHTQPGGEVPLRGLVPHLQHRNGHHGGFLGCSAPARGGKHGVLDPGQAEAAIRPLAYYLPCTTLLCVGRTPTISLAAW